LLGLGNNSPGLSEFGGRIAARGIPTTVQNYGDWPALAQEAIQQYQSGRLRSIMIIGHSLGGSAAVDMASELGRAGVPVELVVTLDPVGGSSQASSNVRRSVNFRPTGSEDHFSVIAAHERDMTNYVLGQRRSAGARAVMPGRGVTP
jgi:thioesterase domain-containing protein